MLKINKNKIVWQENEVGNDLKLFLNSIKILVVLIFLAIPHYYINNQMEIDNISRNASLILNLFLQILMIITGLVIRGRFLKPDFSRAHELGINYHRFRATNPDYRKKWYQIWASILTIVLLPIVSIVIFSSVTNIRGFDIFMISVFYYLSLFMSLLIYPNLYSDNGSITNEKISVNQNEKGNYFSLDLSTHHIDQIGIYLEPKFLFVPEEIVVTFSLEGDYCHKVGLAPNERESSKDQIDELYDWFKNSLGINTIIYENYDEWRNDWQDKLEVKNWI